MKQKMLFAATSEEDLFKVEQMKCPNIEIEENLRWIWRTFMQLNESRSWLGGGMSVPIPSPISFSAVIEWASYYEYSEDATYIAFECIKSMDKIFIEHTLEKQQRDSKVKKHA
jgi:hypothetical protein